MEIVDVVVIGGGVAGLAAAHGLARVGVRKVRVLEREEALCTHSSGRNAAIFRQVAKTVGELPLSLRSRQIMNELLGDEPSWLRRCGNWFVSRMPQPLESLAALASQEHIVHQRAEGAAFERAVPQVAGGESRCGVFFPDDGIIDIHQMTQALARSATRAGVVISLGQEVAQIERDGDRVSGVLLTSGERIASYAVVIAGGAWAESLGASCAAALPLAPLRRHLAILEVEPKIDPAAPIVWDVEHQTYIRPESGGVLSSPGDEEPWRAELPSVSPAALELLAIKLARFAPCYAEASVRRTWACLRTFAPDRAAVIGPDPRVSGLFWLAGLGGHGMTGGPAAGELLAFNFTGRPHPLAADLSPARLLKFG